MKAYKVEILIVDHDNLGKEQIKQEIENIRWPNDCINPIVMSIVGKDKVRRLEFGMGKNDSVDIRAGGPSYLSFWVFTNLPIEKINEVACNHELQQKIKRRGGSGKYTITEEWAKQYVDNEVDLLAKCMKLTNQFGVADLNEWYHK